MSERLNVPVLKTGEGNTSGGSNPPLPATLNQNKLTKNILSSIRNINVQKTA